MKNQAQIEALKTKAENITTQRDAILAKGALSDEDQKTVQGYNDELTGIRDTVKAINDTGEIDKELSSMFGAAKAPPTVEIDPNSEDGKAHIDGKGVLELDDTGRSKKQAAATATKEYTQAFEKYLRSKGDLARMGVSETKALIEGEDTQGGFLVPVEFIPELLQRKPAPTRLASKLTVINCGKDSLVIPRVNYNEDDAHIYTTGMRVTGTGEVPPSSTAHRVTSAEMGQVTIDIKTWMMSETLSNDFVEDSAIPIVPWLMGKFSETRDLHMENMAINGDGVGRNPEGILLSPGEDNRVSIVLSGTANTIDADQVRGMPFELAEQYVENAVWVMNRKSGGKSVALLKDLEDRYLFHRGGIFPGIAEAVPDRLDGFPIIYSAFMPDVAEGTYPFLFGDPSGYIVANRVDMSVQVLREVNAQSNETVVLGRMRFGGKFAQPWTMVAGKADDA